jgi:hypothetical protein
MQNLLKDGHVTKEERGLQVKLYLVSQQFSFGTLHNL